MLDEMVSVCNEKGELTGEQKTKQEAHALGLWHRVVRVCLYTAQGEILLQQRSAETRLYPSRWDISTTGHVLTNEDPLESALREVKEELGLDLHKERFEYIGRYPFVSIFDDIQNRELHYVFFYPITHLSQKYILQKEEVAQVQVVSLERFSESLYEDREAFIPHVEYWSDIIDKLRERIRI